MLFVSGQITSWGSELRHVGEVAAIFEIDEIQGSCAK
jgi:hypothetical protein